MVRYTKDELIEIIKDYGKILSRSPKMREVAYNKDLPPINQFL